MAESPIQKSSALVPAALLRENRSVEGLPEPEGEEVDRRRTYVPPKPTLPWERQPGEPAHAYRGFLDYRGSGDERSIGKTAQSLHLSKSTVHQWYWRYKWAERCAAWDQEADRRRNKAELRAIEQMSQRHVSLALKAQSIVAGALNGMPANGASLSNKDIISWLEKSVRMERRARGLSDSPSLNFNITQQAAFAQQAQAGGSVDPVPQVHMAQRTIADLVAENPALIGDINLAVSGLLEAAERAENEEYSSRNEPAKVVSGE